MNSQLAEGPLSAEGAATGGALLSLDDSRRLARTLRSRTHAERELVRDTFQKVYSDWHAQWALPSIRAGALGNVRLLDVVPESALSDEQARDFTQVALFGERVTRPDLIAGPGLGWAMSEELASEAWDAWQAALSPFLEGSSRASVSSGRVDPWSGGLHIAFPWANCEWVLHMSAVQVDRLLGRRRAQPVPGAPKASSSARLTPLSRAMDGHPLMVRVELGSLTLNLGQLWSLSVGDVVTLDHALDTPAAMYLVPSEGDGTPGQTNAVPLCASWLGQSSGHMAVELLPLS